MSPAKTTADQVDRLQIQREAVAEIVATLWASYLDENEWMLSQGILRAHDLASKRIDELDDEIRDLRNGVER